VQSNFELELAVGDTIWIGNRALTLLDIEGELGLFQIDADEELRPVSNDEFYELFAAECDAPCLPR
jgi:hypothetical protein